MAAPQMKQVTQYVSEATPTFLNSRESSYCMVTSTATSRLCPIFGFTSHTIQQMTHKYLANGRSTGSMPWRLHGRYKDEQEVPGVNPKLEKKCMHGGVDSVALRP